MKFKKRGKDFWVEFELYLADLLVGLVVNVALVGMLAPYARLGKPSISSGFLGRMQKAYAALPSRLLIILIIPFLCLNCFVSLECEEASI